MNEDYDLIYSGSYIYKSEGRSYSEEDFEVLKNYQSLQIKFISNIHMRIGSGELLKINVEYNVNSSFFPLSVIIAQNIGKKTLVEVYNPLPQRQMLEVHVDSPLGSKSFSIPAPLKYQIATPSCACSALFTLSKKYDSVGMNSYSIVSGQTTWDKIAPPISNDIFLKLIGTEKLEIQGNKLSSTKYCILSDPDDDKINEHTPSIYLSKHLSIPYQICPDPKTFIQINQLKNVEKDRLDDMKGPASIKPDEYV